MAKLTNKQISMIAEEVRTQLNQAGETVEQQIERKVKNDPAYKSMAVKIAAYQKKYEAFSKERKALEDSLTKMQDRLEKKYEENDVRVIIDCQIPYDLDWVNKPEKAELGVRATCSSPRHDAIEKHITFKLLGQDGALDVHSLIKDIVKELTKKK